MSWLDMIQETLLLISTVTAATAIATSSTTTSMVAVISTNTCTDKTITIYF